MKMNKEELKKAIDEQEKENIRLFEIFKYRLQDKECQPLIVAWREGSYRLKQLEKQYYEIVDNEHAEKTVKEKEEKTFVNGFGEATNRYITTATYERSRKRKEKEIVSFLGRN